MINDNEINKLYGNWDKLSNSWDSTVVLFITTHGIVVKENEDSDINTFVVPDGLTIKRASASTPGECNIIEPEIVDSYVSLVNAFMSELLSNRETTQNDAIRKVFNSIHNKDKSELKNKRKYVKTMDKYGDDDDDDEYVEDYRRYVRNFGKGFSYKEFHSGDTIINKKFERKNSESTKNDWVIKVMNLPGNPDLFSFLKRQTRHGDSITTLKEITDFLLTKEVTNIIIFDMTCSNIMMPDDKEYPERTVRRLRRDIIDRKIGGIIRKRSHRKRSHRKY
jgi:hypothetical protein